jgi:hypothetical protein
MNCPPGRVSCRDAGCPRRNLILGDDRGDLIEPVPQRIKACRGKEIIEHCAGHGRRPAGVAGGGGYSSVVDLLGIGQTTLAAGSIASPRYPVKIPAKNRYLPKCDRTTLEKSCLLRGLRALSGYGEPGISSP